jgi:L-ascorbate metabolism protein UlaG (beta-lactamase superfamily)
VAPYRGAMRITKFGHACVRLEAESSAGGKAVVVLDPGAFTEPEAVDGATAVLITHEHPDHYLADTLRRTDAPVFTIAAVAEKIREEAPDVAERITVVKPGQKFDPGVPTKVVGEQHAVIHPELPRFDNSGYLLDLGDITVFHPGDALTVPKEEVDLLLLPVSAPWLKVSECIDYARDVGAQRSLGIHDAIYSEIGHGIVTAQLQRFLGERAQTYVRLESGQDL